MPYKHELANPLGFLPLLEESQRSWLEERLSTYDLVPFGEAKEDSYLALKKIKAEELPPTLKLERAIGVDGSLTVSEDPEISLIKIASVWADLTQEPRRVKGVLDPSYFAKKYREYYSLGLIPGRGVYAKGKEGTWDTKRREEFYSTLRHMTVHGSSRHLNLVAWLKSQLMDYAEENPLRCPYCGQEKIQFDGERGFVTFCDLCNSDVYFTDYLSSSLFSAGGAATTPMLLCEQTLFQALIYETAKGNVPNHTLGNTIFVADGPLRLFKLPHIAEHFLGNMRRLRPAPAVVSFMKSGHIEKIFSNPKAEESLAPGELAIITEEMRGHEAHAFKTQAASGLYGKSFAYRTKDGQKRFGFMVPPMRGDLQTGGVPVLDEWSTYPHLRAICDFIEVNQTNGNGPTVASLELIAQANKAASLPAVLSRKLFQELLEESFFGK